MLLDFFYYNYFFGLPTLLQQVRGYSESNTGLIMLALAGFSVIVTPIAGRLIDNKGSKPAVIVGAVLLLTGTGLLITYQYESVHICILFHYSILGIRYRYRHIIV